MTTHDAAVAFSALCTQDARLMELLNRYEDDPMSMPDHEFTEMCNRMDRIHNNPFVQNLMFQTMAEDDE